MFWSNNNGLYRTFGRQLDNYILSQSLPPESMSSSSKITKRLFSKDLLKFSSKVVCMFFDNFWRQKKSNLMKKKSIYGVYVFWYFLMSSVIRIAEAFYMPLDDILHMFDGWRMCLYQILLKKAFVEHEIGFFYFPQHLEGLYWATGRTILIGRYT